MTGLASQNNTTDDEMSDYGGFPMSVIVTGFFVTSLAYLICFCCCIVQFFLRRNRAMAETHGQNIFGQNIHLQKNDNLKRKLLRQFTDSLKRFKKTRASLPSDFVREEGLPLSCPICFEDYTGNVEEIFIGYIKPCKHFYHFHCIWQWLENRGNCPLCRGKVKLKEDDIKGISLRNLPKYLKDHGITISKEDHVVINLDSDSDSSINGGTNQQERENSNQTSSVQTNTQTPSPEDTERSENIPLEEFNQVTVNSGDVSSENDTLTSQKSSGSSEIYVRNNQPSVNTTAVVHSTDHVEQTNNNHNNTSTISSGTLDRNNHHGNDHHVISTRIEIRASPSGLDNPAFQTSATDPV